MNKPYIEIVRFDAEDVIATSGVVNCTVSPLKSGDRILHYNHNSQNYFVYDYGSNTNEYVGLGDNPTLKHNNQVTDYTSVTKQPGSSTTGAGYSAYIYDDADGWHWWDDDYGSHGDY